MLERKYAVPALGALCALMLIGISAAVVARRQGTGYNAEGSAEHAGLEGGAAEVAEEVFNTDTVRINEDTRMVYEYYYLGDGYMERLEESTPYFLIDMDIQTLESLYSDWRVMSFSRDEVVLRKEIEGKSTQYYVIGVHEGFVAVFYAEETEGSDIKELTDMPVSALAPEEQARLREGILVAGDDELFRVMEDYGS